MVRRNGRREDPEITRKGREDPEVIRRDGGKGREDPEVVRREAAVITELRRQVAGQQGKFVKVGRGGGGEQRGKQRQRGDRTQNNAQPAVAAETRPSRPRPGGGQPARSVSADPHHQRQWILRIPEAGRDRDRDGGHQLRRDSWRLSSSDLSEADSWADKRRVTH